jgi:lipopolysaccharide/colanic/teichoic acid biosynthesis glycosyltransferase
MLALPAIRTAFDRLDWAADPTRFAGANLVPPMRTGKHGRHFRMYKLRTMVNDAELLKLDCAHLNQRSWPDFKIVDDPRVTRVGRILRKTSLDELPQLFNVLKGDMSIVGPRPTSFAPETYQAWQTARLAVLPGITGLWQVSGRSMVEFDQRVRLDLEYIGRQCLWLDLQIMLRTCGQLFSGDGAF